MMQENLDKERKMNTPDNKQNASEEPIYNIGAVARMTGIPVATLRVWERRYEFPRSARTAGGHRLYSEKQVARLRWVKARVDEGLQAGQAVRALQLKEREGRFPEVPSFAQPETRSSESAASLAVYRERLTTSLLAHDIDQADQVLGEAVALHPLDDLVLDAIVPTLADIGQGWMEGHVSVAAEHLATHYIRHRLVMWTLTGPPPYPVRPTVLACAPGELHEGSLLILGVLLRRRRWSVAYLGQTVPLPDLATFVQETKPPAVVLVAATEEPARALAEWPQHLPNAAKSGRPIVAYGGRIFTEQPEWREKTPGTFLGASLQEGIVALERLLRDATSLIG
jgi:DNA-binding transcriptional MerR regulator